jgi:hypothetical protein
MFCDVVSVADALSVSSTKPCIVQTSVDGPYDNAPVDTFPQEHSVGTTALGGGGVIVWG